MANPSPQSFSPESDLVIAHNDEFELLIFDWDGTLMDSIGPIAACMEKTVEDLGLPAISTEVIRRTVGLGLRETMDQLFPGCSEELSQTVLRHYRDLWLGGYRDRTDLFERVAETLQALADRNYRLAVATGKSRAGLDRDLGKTGLGDHFEATRTVDEAFSKPHPKMLLDILEELGVGVGASLMIGDTTFDLEMAANAGTRALAVLSGSHRRDELLRLSPLACLDRVSELPAWLTD